MELLSQLFFGFSERIDFYIELLFLGGHYLVISTFLHFGKDEELPLGAGGIIFEEIFPKRLRTAFPYGVGIEAH